MPSHQQTQNSPYRAEQIQALVLDVACYPEFLPWCKAARIMETHSEYFIAELVIAFKGFRESYVSKVVPKQSGDILEIDVSLVKGPFKNLHNYWRITPKESGCEIYFELDFAFKGMLLNRLITALFERATEKMVDAFSARADALYSGGQRGT